MIPPVIPTGAENFTLGHLYLVGLNLIAYLTFFIITSAIIAIIWGGFLMITSGGNEEKVKSAKGIITFAVVALAVLLLARVFVGQGLKLLSANCPWDNIDQIKTEATAPLDPKVPEKQKQAIIAAALYAAQTNPGCLAKPEFNTLQKQINDAEKTVIDKDKK